MLGFVLCLESNVVCVSGLFIVPSMLSYFDVINYLILVQCMWTFIEMVLNTFSLLFRIFFHFIFICSIIKFDEQLLFIEHLKLNLFNRIILKCFGFLDNKKYICNLQTRTDCRAKQFLFCSGKTILI